MKVVLAMIEKSLYLHIKIVSTNKITMAYNSRENYLWKPLVACVYSHISQYEM